MDLRPTAVSPYWAQISQDSDGIPQYVLARLTVFYQCEYSYITGGFGGIGNSAIRHQTTELVYLNGTTMPGPLLPKSTSEHCMVKYENTIFSIGGNNDARKVWMFEEKGIYDSHCYPGA